MLRNATLLLLATVAAILAVIGVPLQHPGLGLDAAWQQALVEATEHHWVFGRDLIFSYGPLHQLATHQISTNLLPLLLGRTLYAIAWGAATALLGLLAGVSTALALVVFIACTSPENPASTDALFNLLCILGVLCALAPLRRGSRGHSRAFWSVGQPVLMSLQAMGIAIGTLVKLSYLGAALPALTAIAWCQIQNHRHRGALAGLAASGAMPIFSLGMVILAWTITSSRNLADLVNYYTGPNLDIIAGYSDAMSYATQAASLALPAAYGFGCLLSGTISHIWLHSPSPNSIDNRPENGHILSISLGSLCLALIAWAIFKASFVRDDPGHTTIGTYTILGFVIIVTTWIIHEQQKHRNRIHQEERIIAIALISTAAIYAKNLPFETRLNARMLSQTWQSIRMLFNPQERLLLSSKRNQDLKTLRKQAEDYLLPPMTSADVISQEITSLLANQLRYQPRPIPQSYSAYTTRLQQVNANHFASSRSQPETVILNLVDIDGRLPITPDSPGLRRILEHYSFSHHGNRGSLILRRSSQPGSIKRMGHAVSPHRSRQPMTELSWHPLANFRHQSNAISIPRSASRAYLTIRFQNSLQRTLLSAVYRPSPVWIDYLDRNNKVLFHFRFIPQAGLEMLIWPPVTTNEDFARLVRGYRSAAGTTTTAERHDVVAVRFVTTSLGPPFSRTQYRLDSESTLPLSQAP